MDDKNYVFYARTQFVKDGDKVMSYEFPPGAEEKRGTISERAECTQVKIWLDTIEKTLQNPYCTGVFYRIIESMKAVNDSIKRPWIHIQNLPWITSVLCPAIEKEGLGWMFVDADDEGMDPLYARPHALLVFLKPRETMAEGSESAPRESK